ncbi:MAG: 2-hydroxychromene-2-carboxylate isomerase [Sandaracinaceae bacterium]
MSARIEVFFDVVCPYAYLASTQLDALARRTGAVVSLRPMSLGGLFREIGQLDDPNRAMSAAKAEHGRRDLARWAQRFGVPLRMPVAHPRRTVLPMRAITAAFFEGTEAGARATHALFDAYWVRSEDVADLHVVARALGRVGLDGEALVARTEHPAVRDALFATTREAARRGVFGAPTFFVTRPGAEESMFWGQDRLDWVEAATRPDGEAQR